MPKLILFLGVLIISEDTFMLWESLCGETINTFQPYRLRFLWFWMKLMEHCHGVK